MLYAHLSVGYLITHSLIKTFKLNFTWYWIFLGLFSAIIPDLDIIYQLFTGNMAFTHRYYITNLPLFYLIIFTIIVILNSFIKKKWLKYGNFIIFTNIFIHLLLDTAFYGIRWFWPIYPKLIAIYNINGIGGIRVENYYHHWYWYLELIIMAFVPIFIIYCFVKGKFKNSKQ